MSANLAPTLLQRYQGSLLGLACGDAVGTSVEFSPRGSFTPLTDMRGGGPFGLQAGQWTDDTSMALCLAESLITKQGFDAHDQMTRYVNWWRWGYLSATGECFDIGMTVCSALQKFLVTGDALAGATDPKSAGNGSLMRLVPIVLYYYPDLEKIQHFSALSSRTTHGAPEAIQACMLFASLLASALAGESKTALIRSPVELSETKLQAIADGNYLAKSVDQIRGNGYAVDSLEAALWCFQHTESFAQAVLTAANLGEDADTTAAIVGQIAGAHYGVQAIPATWLTQLHMRQEIQTMASSLFQAASHTTSITE